MSLIGTLEQFSLSTVLQRIERHEKTGLLVLKNPDSQWIEFYLHEGRLLCIGPVRTHASLGVRLLQDGVISHTVLREASLVLGNTDANESLMARTLMELNYVSREELRSWAIQKVVDVLKVVLGWPEGEMYFEEGTLPPADRLLVSMSVSSLLASSSPISSPAPQRPASPTSRASTRPLEPLAPPAPAAPAIPATPAVSQPLATLYPDRESMAPSTPSPDFSRMPTLMDASQFIDDTTFSASSLLSPFPAVEPFVPKTEALSPAAESFASGFADDQLAFSDSPFASGQGEDVSFPTLFSDADDAGPSSAPASSLPVPVMQPVPPKRIDISFMQPDMQLVPADLSAYRDQNPHVQLTPDQWRILTLIDGRNSLQMICQMLGAPAEIVCNVAGELIAEGLVHVTMPGSHQVLEMSPMVREMNASGMGNGYMAPGYSSAAASPWSVSLPVVPTPPMDAPQALSPTMAGPIPTESQWGNGENGATFIPGHGWVMNPPPVQQPFQSNGPQGMPGGMYAPSGVGY